MIIAAFNGFELQPVHEGDAWKICDFITVNSDRLQRYFPKTLAQNLTPTLSQLFVEKKLKEAQAKTEFLFTLKHSESRLLVGLIYLKELDWNKKQGEFAYCIDYKFEGNDLSKKAVSALSKYAFETLGLATLQIIVHKDNIPSVKVALANNFTWIKTLEQSFAPPGENALDMELYELYKTSQV